MSASTDVPDRYNTPVPSTILTPDRVETRIGTLEFADGFPSDETAAKVFDHLDFLRAVEVFLQCIPAASMEGLRAGLTGIGCDAAHKMALADHLLDSNPLFLTGNTDTVYALAMLDLDRDGPTVVEIPPGCGPGTVNDAWFRFVIDMGTPGPDRGAGRYYLLVPPGYDGEIPDGYHVAHSPQFHQPGWRFAASSSTARPTRQQRCSRTASRSIPCLLLAISRRWSSSPSPARRSTPSTPTTRSSTRRLADVIRREPIEVIDPETRGLLASIGIHKDHVFEPDERMHAILVDAAAVGNATRPRDLLPDPRPARILLPRPPLEDRLRRGRLPVARWRRTRRAQHGRPDAVLLPSDA